MKKIFVLDTSVPAHLPECFTKFAENDIKIPYTVLQELNGLRKGSGQVAFNAREALRTLDALREKGPISQGVGIGDEGGTLQVIMDCKLTVQPNNADNRILSTAISLQEDENRKPESKRRRVVLVTKDVPLRVMAGSHGMTVEDFKNDKAFVYEKYGYVAVKGQENENGIKSVRYMLDGEDLYRISGKDNIVQVKRRSNGIQGIRPKNIEQEALIDAILCDDVTMVCVTGRAGTGKTILSLAGGLALVERKPSKNPAQQIRTYDRMLVTRPVVVMGQDLGYLPGDLGEKMSVYMNPIIDNLDVIVGTPFERKEGAKGRYRSSQYLIESGVVCVEPLPYIRGRSLPGVVFVVDEAQSLLLGEVRTIVTRMGQGSKLLIEGDLFQIDHVHLDRSSSGLAQLIDRFIQQEDFCYLNLQHSARSSLAERGATLL